MTEMTPIDNPLPILAAVIGINRYSSEDYHDLAGAIVDADRFEVFLTQRMRVPRENIRSLRDEQASRKAIIESMLFLRDDEKYKKDEVAIVIYFSGHGASTNKPAEWGDWDTPNGRIEMLCPSDIDTEQQVSGIPDRTISALLNQIAARKGDNITVILDCCSSAGMNRGIADDDDDDDDGDYLIRHIEYPPLAQFESDHQFWPAGTRGSAVAEGYSGRLRGSHILLAACGRDQLAYESRETKQGFFTSSLLKILASDEFDRLTYTSLMDKLVMPKRQTPHCEGEGKHRRLFNNRGGGADTSLFLAKRKKDGTITLEAGTMHGIRPGSLFSVHKTNLIDTPLLPNPCIGKLRAVDVNPLFSSLELPSTQRYRIPWKFYCKVLDSASPRISLFSRNRQWLEHIFPPADCTLFSIQLVDKIDSCDLELTLEGDNVYFDQHNVLVTPHLGSRIQTPVQASDKYEIQKVVKASMHFYDHLTRTSSDEFDVRMEMHALVEDNQDGCDDTILKPVGKNLIAEEPATVVVEVEKPLGMTISNDGNSTLYPYLFYFDPTELSIVSWFSPPIGAGYGRHTAHHKPEPSHSSLNTNIDATELSAGGDAIGPWHDTSPPNTNIVEPPQIPIGIDAPLLPHSKLAIGYGAGASEPWEFWIPEGKDKDIGFVRLFLSNRPVSFDNILQESPFQKTRDMNGVSAVAREVGPLDRWAVKSATIIQVRKQL